MQYVLDRMAPALAVEAERIGAQQSETRR